MMSENSCGQKGGALHGSVCVDVVIVDRIIHSSLVSTLTDGCVNAMSCSVVVTTMHMHMKMKMR